MTRFYIKDTEEFDRACRLRSTSTTRRYEHAAT